MSLFHRTVLRYVHTCDFSRDLFRANNSLFLKHIEVNASLHTSEFAKMRLFSPLVFSLWSRIFHIVAGDCCASEQSKCMLSVIQPFIMASEMLIEQQARTELALRGSVYVWAADPKPVSNTAGREKETTVRLTYNHTLIECIYNINNKKHRQYTHMLHTQYPTGLL